MRGAIEVFFLGSVFDGGAFAAFIFLGLAILEAAGQGEKSQFIHGIYVTFPIKYTCLNFENDLPVV